MLESLNCLQILKKRCKGFWICERAIVGRLWLFYFVPRVGYLNLFTEYASAYKTLQNLTGYSAIYF